MYRPTKSDLATTWERFKSIPSRIDLVLIFFIICLLSVGVCFIYGIGQGIGGFVEGLWMKQLVWIGFGGAIFVLLTSIDYRELGPFSWILYIIGIISLLLVFVIGVKSKGATRWINLYFVRVQPSEFAKFATLVFLSYVMSLKQFNVNKLKYFVLVGAIAVVPFILILKEPDLGSSLVLIPITGALIFIANFKWRYIIILSILGLSLVPAVYPFLKPYQKQRIQTFLHPEKNQRGTGWHQLQAELAVGSGGEWGKGYMNATQSMLGFLPETHTDFIFSNIAEETGFWGSVTLLFLYLGVLFCAVRTAFLCKDQFGKNIAIGIAVLIFTHSVINIGMSIRLMPVTGLPLPLVSYGGSFIISTLIYLGLLHSVYVHRVQED